MDIAKISWLQNCPKSFVKACWNHKFLIFLFNCFKKKHSKDWHHTNWLLQKALFLRDQQVVNDTPYEFLGVGAAISLHDNPVPTHWGWSPTLKLSLWKVKIYGFEAQKKRNQYIDVFFQNVACAIINDSCWLITSGREITCTPWDINFGTQTRRFGSDDIPLQMGDF